MGRSGPVPGQAGELGARDQLAGRAVLLGGRVGQHGAVLEERDALGYASRRKDGTVVVELYGRQARRGLARARARKLRNHLRSGGQCLAHARQPNPNHHTRPCFC